MQSFLVERSRQSLMIIVGVLTVIGLIMVFSSSYIYSREVFLDSALFFKKQIFFCFIGVAGAYFIQRVPFETWSKYSFHLLVALTLVTLCVFIPGLGIEMKGSNRWLNLGITRIQPAEFLKLSLLLASAFYFNKFHTFDKQERIIKGAILGLPLLIVLCQPDFGAFFICLMIILFCCFLSPFPRKYFYGAILTSLSAIPVIILLEPYRVQRLLTYLDPWKDPRKAGFQIIQSFLAFANGSLFGKGIGNSNEKLFYLPEAHNDFIFSVIGEELGFVGVLLIVFLFIGFVYFGLRASLHMRKRHHFTIVAAVTFAISLQAILNMGVVLGVLPTKGLNLPFVSYGGSSLIVNFLAFGILLSALKSSEKESVQHHSQSQHNYTYRSLG